MTTYVALLRGINVGGKNLIKMPELKACFEQNGFADVATYIQSGNVLFASPASRNASMTDRIEEMLAESFDYVPTVVVRSRKQMRLLSEGAAHSEKGDRAGSDEPRRRHGPRRHRGPVLLEADREGHAEPAQQDHFVADLPERDDPQLEHDDEAPVVDGRALLTGWATSAWLALRSPRPGASEPPSSRARSAADGRTRR
jgi:Protein of unknown function (DUF1697)